MEVIKRDGMLWYVFSMLGVESNMYMTIHNDDALIVDPNINDEALVILKDNKVSKILVLLTHEHFDHISGVNWLRDIFDTHVVCGELGAEALENPNKNLAKYWKVLLMDKSEEKQREAMTLQNDEYACFADETFSDSKEWGWCGHRIRGYITPGHSKGSVVYTMDNKLLFSGDSLVNGYGVICRLPGGKWKVYEEKTLPFIIGLPQSIYVFPGHGKPDILENLKKYLVKFGEI